MTAESSPRLKSPDSFGETAAPPCDVARAGRVRMAVALLVVGLFVAFVPALAAGEDFLPVVQIPVWDDEGRSQWVQVATRHHMGRTWYLSPWTSATTMVRSDAAWAAIAISLVLVPALFAWWRGAGFRVARTAGLVCAVAASASVVALVMSMQLSHVLAGVWWTVPAGGALMAVAFVVAPAPRRRDE